MTTFNEEVRRLRRGLPSVCPRCCEAGKLGDCPYWLEIGAVETECGCCDECRDMCAMEV